MALLLYNSKIYEASNYVTRSEKTDKIKKKNKKVLTFYVKFSTIIYVKSND